MFPVLSLGYLIIKLGVWIFKSLKYVLDLEQGVEGSAVGQCSLLLCFKLCPVKKPPADVKPLISKKEEKLRVVLRLFSSDEGGKEGLVCSCSACERTNFDHGRSLFLL